jgi:hypothetical protein
MAESQINKDLLEKILDEIAGYDIQLETDPTKPSLGNAYLQKVLAQCRNYLNRVTYYLQQTKRHEKELRGKVKMLEMDLDFKMQEKLADDVVVRKQPSLEDRKAVASVMLKTEYDQLVAARAELLDAEETAKLIRARLDHLNRTNADIKLQRQMVRDDRSDQMNGGEGYGAPHLNRDGSVPGGLPPPIAPPVDPKDILDPKSRPEDMPEPVDGTHAQQLADFYSRESAPSQAKPDESSAQKVSYEDLLS